MPEPAPPVAEDRLASAPVFLPPSPYYPAGRRPQLLTVSGYTPIHLMDSACPLEPHPLCRVSYPSRQGAFFASVCSTLRRWSLHLTSSFHASWRTIVRINGVRQVGSAIS